MPITDRVRSRVARLRRSRWRAGAWSSGERHIIIGGSPRSGTTLLRRTLDRHPGICCGPESSIFLPAALRIAPVAAGFDIPEAELQRMLAASPSQGAFIDAFARRYREQRQRPRWAEKTPLNVRHIGWILDRFPEARFVHVIRDGRDVACSMREHPDRQWTDAGWVKVHRPLPLERYARRWVADTTAGIAHRGHPRYLEVRYEDLVQDPAGTLERLLDALGEPFDPAILIARPAAVIRAGAAITSSSAGRWRTDLAPDEQALVGRVEATMLSVLGYPDV